MTETTPPIDVAHLRKWVGKTRVAHDTADLQQCALMSATLDIDNPVAQPGEPLPPLWNWIYFPEALRPAELDADGHPMRGGFLPPVTLANRMWAGGRFVFHQPIPAGSRMEKRSRIKSVDHKRGKVGDLVFVTVQHDVWVGDECCVAEEHDIVYREATPYAANQQVDDSAGEMARMRRWTPDSVQLFRYSALTFNSNPVHFDADYCRQVAGYPNILVHGPLTATMLAGVCAELAAVPLKTFSYRARTPFILGDTACLRFADRSATGCRTCAVIGSGAVAMEATASW